MAELELKYTPRFARDYKTLAKKRDMAPLHEVFALVLANTLESREELVRRHNMHTLSGEWSGSNECHVCNAGDWLVIWTVNDGIAYFQRTGSHDELFRK